MQEKMQLSGHGEFAFNIGKKQIPKIFCWTKIGAEAGQSLEEIVWRKEMERLTGNGIFCWGIGNALGNAPELARQASSASHIDVLFTPMKSPPKEIDQKSKSIVIWLTYFGAAGYPNKLSDHMLVTSRGVNPSGGVKRNHYALMCNSQMQIRADGQEVMDAARARNFGSANPVGSSQVTAIVSYEDNSGNAPKNPYCIAFRARLVDEGFVRLGTPVELRDSLLEQFRDLWEVSTLSQWRRKVSELKLAAWQAGGKVTSETDLFENDLSV